MVTVHNHLLSAAFRLAGPSLTPDLMTRLREETLSLFRARAALPEHVVDEVIASGDRELLETLAGAAVGEERWSALLRLAALGDPSLARMLYDQPMGGVWREELRRAVLAAAAKNPDDPGWRAPDGLVSSLLSTTSPYDLTPALCAPFPDLVRHALENTSGRLTAARQREACQAVLTHGGVAELASLAGLDCLHPEVAELARKAAAAPDPAAVLEAAELSGTAERTAPGGAAARSKETPPAPVGQDLIHRLRQVVFSRDAFVLDTVDWELVLAEHRKDPFPGGALIMLASRRDCPDELVLASYQLSRLRRLPEGSPLPWALLSECDWSGSYSVHPLSLLLQRGIGEGAYPVDRVLAEVRPARQVLTALPFGEEPVRRAMAELVRPLGDDFAVWRAVYSLLSRFGGSSTELIAAAVEQRAKHRGKSWPRPLAAEYPVKEPEGARAAFLNLFSHAAEDVQSAVVAHLDLRSVQHLLVFHTPSSALRDRLVALHGRAVLAVRASRWELPVEQIEELLVLDEPEINTKLYVYTALTDAQRRGVLAGRRFGTAEPDPGQEPLPITEELIRHIQLSGRRHWLLPICDSGDPRLARVLLGKIKLHTLAGQLRLLVRVWERHGAEEVRALLAETEFPERRSTKHPLPPATHTIARKALEAADGLTVLREELVRSLAPAGKVAFLRAQSGGARDQIPPALERLAEETSPGLPWEELVREHGREPLPDALLAELAQRKDFPEALREESLYAELRLEHGRHPNRLTGPRPSARDLVRALPLPRPHCRDAWLDKALAHGQLTLLDVLREARPAQDAAAYLASRQKGGWEGRREVRAREACQELRDLVAAHLGKDPEAWAVAMRLLPGFSGTVPELLATAAAVVS